MKTLKLSIITLILVFSSITNVQSENSMADYRRLKDDKPFEQYLGGYLTGNGHDCGQYNPSPRRHHCYSAHPRN
jgi:hypothetical protein